ncbi:DeoR family transcriptional regulator, partial [Streptomyces sp. URMC 128]
PGGDAVPGRQQRRDVPLPGPRRQVPGAGSGLRSASMLGEQSPGAERARVADLRRR